MNLSEGSWIVKGINQWHCTISCFAFFTEVAYIHGLEELKPCNTFTEMPGKEDQKSKRKNIRVRLQVSWFVSLVLVHALF